MAVAWVTVLWATAAGGGAAGVAGLAVAMDLFAVGETLMAPTVPAIVNDLAPEPTAWIADSPLLRAAPRSTRDESAHHS